MASTIMKKTFVLTALLAGTLVLGCDILANSAMNRGNQTASQL